MEDKDCCYPKCKEFRGVQNGFCPEHADLANFILSMVRANIQIDDIV